MDEIDLDAIMPLLRANGALVLEGVAGIGKTHSIEKVRACLSDSFDLDALNELLDEVIKRNEGEPKDGDLSTALQAAQEDKHTSICSPRFTKVTILVMHPSTSYEEMIGGLRPAPSGNGSMTFTWQPGKLTRAISDAIKDMLSGVCRNHLVVLDEINRCNLPSVLGELIYLIEPSRRVPEAILEKAKSSPDELADFREKFSIALGPEGGDGDLFIPSNLFFLGTMNSSDRSILGFDQALRRRFPPYRLEPMHQEALTEELKPDASGPLAKGIAAWSALNSFLRFVIGPDAMIGHSYWFQAANEGGNENQACGNAWRFGVLPQAIQAAESARQEACLASLFKAAKAAKDAADASRVIKDEGPVKEFFDTHIECRENYETAWTEAVTACRANSTGKTADLLPNIGEMEYMVQLVGNGHGEKLVITKK